MDRQKQTNELTRKRSDQTRPNDYTLDELLAKSPQGAFSLDFEDKRWLNGSLVEKANC
mgnify:CR=1 FL=1|jgi:hypothetical protein